MNRPVLLLLALLPSTAGVALAKTSAPTEPTLVTVRAVARGAKLLGSNVGGARITVSDVETGERLAAGFQEGTSGETLRIMEASPGGDGPVYDTPGAAKFEAMLAISEPRRVEIVAEGPLGSPHAVARASRTLLVVPGEHVVGEGVVLELQGYRMAIEEPATDDVVLVGSALHVRATVTMLCGCPLRPGGLWDSDRVRIVARLRPHGEGDVVETPLRFAGVDSTFEGEVTVAAPGPFTLEVVATDPSSGNGGVVAVRGEAVPAPELAGDLLIDHVAVHSMLDESVATDHAVLVRGSEIVWTGPSANARQLRAEAIVDGGGAHLVPGLVDLHVHLVDERDLELYLLHGVTTIVNLGSRLDAVGLRERIRAGAIGGPDILTSGRILDHEPGPSYFVAVGTSPDAARAEVERQIASGADLIKLYDGLDGPTHGAAVAAAHAAGRPVFGHAPRSIDFAETLDRIDVVAHGEEFFYTFFENRDDGSRLAEAARLAAERGVAVIPNTGFIRTILDQAEDIDGFLSREEVRYVSPPALPNWLPEINRYVGRGPEWLARNRRMHPFLHRLTAALRSAGVPLFAGSDAGAVGGIPGFSLHQEIAELRLSGLAPFEALAAATRVPGDWLAEHIAGAAPRGAIEVGRRADLLLVDGDPVADPAALEHARAVVAGGRLQWTEELRRQLAPLVAENERRLAWHAEVRARLAGDDLGALEALLDDAPSPEFAERVVNGLGYAALGRDGDVERAVALFELNTRRFPESWNVWDSLGEGLAERGDRTEAIAAYERSLELHPENSNARERIARLSAP